MAFFKFRWPGQGEKAQAEKPSRRPRAPQAESIEVMRRRARHRLIGAAVLVLVGVVGFPMLFDTQPRPVPVDIPIEIPDRNKVAPLVVPAPVAQAPAAVRPSTPPSQETAPAPRPAQQRNSSAVGNGLADGEELVQGAARPAASRPSPATPAKPEAKPEPKPETKPSTPTEPRPVQRPDESARARALLEGRTADSTAASATSEEGRFIVQVGAFADADKAREARTKVERAGMKTYTQVVDTKDGKRTRVRVGPFTSRAEADKAAARIRALDLSASVLTL